MNNSRLGFEEFITRSPFEKCIDRFPNHNASAWPGSYQDLSVELAWESWQARRKTLKGKVVGTVDRVGIMNRSAPYTNLPEGTKLYTHPANLEMLETTDVWQFFSNGEWWVGSNINNHKQNTIDGGYIVRDLCVFANH